MKTWYTCLFLFLGLGLISPRLLGQSISINPNSGYPGDAFGVTITGIGTSWASSPTHCVEIFDGNTTISFTGTTVSTTTLTGTVNIPLNATFGAYQARVFTGASCAGATDGTCTNCFTVLEPTISVTPSAGIAGHTETITITGQGTKWTPGSSHCVTLSNGTTSLTFTGTASSATSITGSLTIPFSASVSPAYDVRVFDDNAGQCSGTSLRCVGCFTVNPAPAIAINPDSGSLGSVFPVTITGASVLAANTSTHCVRLTNGNSTITFTATKANGSTNLTGTITVPAGAVLGDYEVVIFPDGGDCLGNNVGYCEDCFKVIELPTSIDREGALAFSLYPNPSLSAEVTVSFGQPLAAETRVEVYDLMGKRILSPAQLAPNETETVLNTGLLPSGMYLVVVSQEGTPRVVRRLIRQ